MPIEWPISTGLAGSSATVGYADLSALARALEHALRFRHGNEAIVPLLAELRAALQPLLQGLQDWMLQAVQGHAAPEHGVSPSAGAPGPGMTLRMACTVLMKAREVSPKSSWISPSVALRWVERKSSRSRK